MHTQLTLRNRSGRHRAGFTLVEILAAIAIISLLVAIVLPAFSRARLTGQQTRCQANLRQLGLAQETYAGNRDDYYPSWSHWHAWGYYGTPLDGTGGDDPGAAWTELLKEDGAIPGVEVFSCPSFPQGIQIAYFQTGYAAWEREGERATKRGWINRPSEFVLSGDCTNRVFYKPPFGTNTHPFNDADIDNADVEASDWSKPIHLGKNLNMLYSDGHAASDSGFRPTKMTFDTKLPGVAWGDLDL